MNAYRDYRKAKTTPRVRVALEKDTSHLSLDDPDAAIGQLLLIGAIGARDLHFYEMLISQLADVSRQGRAADERGLNFMRSVMKGIAPRDHIEAMLAAQMAPLPIMQQ